MNLRKVANSKYWIAQFRVNGQMFNRSTKETDRRKAEKAAEEIERQVRLLYERRNVARKFSEARVAEVALLETDVSKGQAERTEIVLWNFQKWAGDLPLDRIDNKLLEDYQRYRLHQQKAAKATVEKELWSIARMLRRNGSSVVKPKPKPGKATEQRAFSAEELKKFFASCPAELKSLFLLMLCTGARPAELIPSEKSTHIPILKRELDLEKNTVTIRSAKLMPGSKPTLRKIRIQPELIRMVEETAKSHSLKTVFKPIPALARVFNRIIEDAEIEKYDELGKKVTAHSFRHTFATLMAESVGHNPFIVKQILGHSNITTTDRYCHPTTEAKVIDLAELLGANGVGEPAGGVVTSVVS